MYLRTDMNMEHMSHMNQFRILKFPLSGGRRSCNQSNHQQGGARGKPGGKFKEKETRRGCEGGKIIGGANFLYFLIQGSIGVAKYYNLIIMLHLKGSIIILKNTLH